MSGFAVEDLAVPGTAPLSFHLAPGEVLGVAGASGVGKTRLLRAMADLEPHEGRVLLDGAEQGGVAPADWRRRVVYVATDSAWWHPTVADHFTSWPPPALAGLGLDEATGGQFVERLSSGERQRLAVLRALAMAPRVLLMDEPTANLDDETAAAVESLVAERCRADGLMAVWVTHGKAQRARVAPRSVTVVAA